MTSLRRLASRGWTVLKQQGPLAFCGKLWRKLLFLSEQMRFPYVTTLRLDDGHLIRLYINSSFSKHWYQDGRARSGELAWITTNALRRGDVVADCGANNGFTGMLFARQVGPTGKVFGFEPSPVNLEAARKNIELNAIQKFELVATALGATSGAVRFNPGFGNGSISRSSAEETITVPQTTLDDFFKTGRVDFLKIDVEGYELQVLRGATRLLRQRPKLAIEIHVALLAQPSQELRELFSMLDLAAHDAHIQPEVDGPITRFDPNIHTPDFLARYTNVHLFALPRTQA